MFCNKLSYLVYFKWRGPINESSIQHAARRRQGKNWWNNDWRKKLLAFVKYLSEEDDSIHLYLGSEEIVKINSNPLMFNSPISYNDPNVENLPDEQVFNEELQEDNSIFEEIKESK